MISNVSNVGWCCQVKMDTGSWNEHICESNVNWSTKRILISTNSLVIQFMKSKMNWNRCSTIYIVWSVIIKWHGITFYWGELCITILGIRWFYHYLIMFVYSFIIWILCYDDIISLSVTIYTYDWFYQIYRIVIYYHKRIHFISNIRYSMIWFI